MWGADRTGVAGRVTGVSARFALAVSALAVLAVMGTAAWTRAAAQEIPSSVAPAQIEERFNDRPRQRGLEAPAIERRKAPAHEVPLKKRPFVLSGVVIEGATVYAEASFVPFYEGLLASEVTLADMQAVADKITKRYKKDGYVLSQAVVPRQDVTLGVVKIRVVEGYVGEVLFEGKIEGSESLLKAYGKKITDARPLRISTLERYVLLTEDLPGVRVRPLLEPVDPDAGIYKLVLAIRHKSIDAFAQVDNRGSRFVGPYQFWIGGAFNSVFGLYERSRVRFVTTAQTNELVFVDVSHTEQVGTDGATVTVAGSYSKSEPGFTLTPLRIESRSMRVELRAAYPIIRSRALDFFVTGRFTYRNSKIDRRGREVVDDQLRVLRAGATVSFDDAAKGRNWFATEVSQGLDLFGASNADSPTLSRPGASAAFTKIRFDFSRYQKVGSNWGVFFAAKGQKAFGTVLSSEEVGLGGERFGRAYDPAEIVGKDAAAARIEVQRDGRIADFFVTQYQLYGYYGIGAVWTERDDSRQSLASAGFGVRVRLKHGLFGYVEFAQPLTRPVLANGKDGKDPRIFFVLRASLP